MNLPSYDGKGELKTIRNIFPPGWDEERVNKVLKYYESQSEDEALAEINTAFDNAEYSVMLIPNELVPSVGNLLAECSARNSSH